MVLIPFYKSPTTSSLALTEMGDGWNCLFHVFSSLSGTKPNPSTIEVNYFGPLSFNVKPVKPESKHSTQPGIKHGNTTNSVEITKIIHDAASVQTST